MKKRKAIMLAFSFLLLLSTYFILQQIVYEPSFEENVLSIQEIESIKASKTETTEGILKDLTFENESIPYDESTKTFYLPLNMEEKEWESGHLISTHDLVRVYLTENPLLREKEEVIGENTPYTLLATKGDVYEEYQLVFTGLPILCLDVDGGTEIGDAELFGNMKLYEADTKEEWMFDSQMYIRLRGSSSRKNPKKAYKMTMCENGDIQNENQQSLLGMRTDGEWLLYAIYTEETKIRDMLAIDIWNGSGALAYDKGHYGYHMEYVELFLNGEYWGLYGLMEPVDYKQLDLTKEAEATEENLKEFLFKQKDPDVYVLKGVHQDDTDIANWEFFNEYVNLTETDETAEDNLAFTEKIEEYIDMDSAIDVWIYLQVLLGTDNRYRNMYYPVKYIDGEYKVYFVPWDMDYSFGNVHDIDILNRTRFDEPLLKMRAGWKIGDRLVWNNVNNTHEKIAKRWKELRETVYSKEWISERIEEYYKTVVGSGAMERDSIWEESPHSTDYELFEKIVIERIEFLDYYMEHLEEYMDLETFIE